jgi:hypothetical protein
VLTNHIATKLTASFFKKTSGKYRKIYSPPTMLRYFCLFVLMASASNLTRILLKNQKFGWHAENFGEKILKKKLQNFKIF